VKPPELDLDPERINFILDIAKTYKNLILTTKGTMTTAEIVRSVYWTIDDCIKSEDSYKKSCATCSKGCSSCCHTEVSVSNTEVDLIMEYCNKKGIKINKDYLIKQLKSSPGMKRYKAGNSACVFLKDNLCSIYEIRPFVCRIYRVASNPINCSMEGGRKWIKFLLNEATLGIKMAFDSIFPCRGELPAVLLKRLGKGKNR